MPHWAPVLTHLISRVIRQGGLSYCGAVHLPLLPKTFIINFSLTEKKIHHLESSAMNYFYLFVKGLLNVNTFKISLYYHSLYRQPDGFNSHWLIKMRKIEKIDLFHQ